MKTSIPLFLACLLCIPSHGRAATDEEIIEFKAAYARYNELFIQGDYPGSLPFAEKMLALGANLYNDKSASYAALHYNYAINLLRLQHYKEAVPALQDTLDLYLDIYGKEAEELMSVYADLSLAMRKDDYGSDWEKNDRNLLNIGRKVMGKDSAEYALLLIDTGHTEITNQDENGENRIRDGFKILSSLGTEHPRFPYANFVMAKVEMGHERYKTALPYLQTTVDRLGASTQKADLQLLMTTYAFMTDAYEETHQSDLATESLAEIGRIKESLGDTSAEPVFIVKPVFPSKFNSANTREGWVQVKFDVDENGFTLNHQVVDHEGPEVFIQPSLDAIMKFRYAPKFVNGKPVKLEGLAYVFSFHLYD